MPNVLYMSVDITVIIIIQSCNRTVNTKRFSSALFTPATYDSVVLTTSSNVARGALSAWQPHEAS